MANDWPTILPTRRRRFPMAGHGAGCSPNPEIGCVCGEEERHYLRLEAKELAAVAGSPASATLSHPAGILKAAS